MKIWRVDTSPSKTILVINDKIAFSLKAAAAENLRHNIAFIHIKIQVKVKGKGPLEG